MTAGAVLAPTVIPLRLPTLGKPKQWVDTKTPIEIRCETPNTDIFYTVNGSPPNPFPWFGCDDNTYKYSHPVLLDEGKCILKAIAIDTTKHRESFVVTKTFYVEKAVEMKVDKTGDEDDGKKNEESIESEKGGSGTVVDGNDGTQSQDSGAEYEDLQSEMSSSGSMNSSKEIEFLEKTNGNGTGNDTSVGSSEDLAFVETSQVANIDQLVHSLSCSNCSYSNHANPMAQFCSLCGSQLMNKLPVLITLPRLQQLTTCLQCHCDVPRDMPYCVICEASFGRMTSNSAMKFNDAKSCGECGTLNASQNIVCILCNGKLPKKCFLPAIRPQTTPLLLPTLVHTPRNFAKCEDCGRLNSREARFCDWCSSKLEAIEDLFLECPHCSNVNQSTASFCQGCGYPLQPPVNQDLNTRLIKKTCNRSVWVQPQFKNKSTTPCQTDLYESKAVQTVDSAFSYRSHKWQRMMNKFPDFEESYKSTKSISPGKGYWRQQVEFIAGHLKTLAYNDSNFRAQIAKPKLTKLISATVQERKDELSLMITFTIQEETPVLPVPVPRPIKSSSSNRKLPVIEDSKEKHIADGITIYSAIEDSTDLTELSTILSEFGDPEKVIANRGRALLSLAIRNGDANLVRLLADFGCDLKEFGSLDDNPPLHEAILGGDKSLGVVKALLECGAELETANGRGQTPFDFASSIDNQAALKMLTTHFGKNMLNKMMKAQLEEPLHV